VEQGKVFRVEIEDEVKESYLNYAMSVIVSRALPDVRDGLKPVHRRILYAMNEMGLQANRPFVKAGRIVGDVLGKYHPHGDQSIYDALVRLAQDFSLRYPVVNGQGNFGSLDGDPPAAMRYTEAKLESLADQILADIKKETVDFIPNYDDSLTEPQVLPSAIPFLLLNGASGIAVGMATNMAPHNLTEVCNAISACIDNPDITIKELMQYVTGPDFPMGATIYGRKGIVDAYKTGRGRIPVRANFQIVTDNKGRDQIIITEIPYMVNKANLVKKIADLVKDKKIEGITDLRDESGRDDPVKIVIELKRGIIPKVVLNQLFSHTPLQSYFNVNNLALVNGKPELLNLKQMITYFIEHRKEVIIRRTKFELKKAEARAHILEGLKIALDNIDRVIEIIKKSPNVETARENLIKEFLLSEIQAQAILDMRLQRLTSLETKKIIDELKEVLERIAYLKDLLAHEHKIYGIVKEETKEIKDKFGDERRTKIVHDEIEEFDIEDLIVKEEMVILISHNGLIKRVPLSTYRRQNRGGRGSSTITMREDDFLEQIFIASTHDYLMFITNAGKAYCVKVHEIPLGSKSARGQSVKSLLAISTDEEIATILSFKEFSDETFILMATSRGVVKKVKTSDFSNAKKRGIISIKLDNLDKVVTAKLTDGKDELILITRYGYALRFNETAIRPMGRATRGVTGIKLSKEDELAGVLTMTESDKMLLVSEYGFGKRIECNNFTPHNRATRGQICYKISEKTGELIGVLSAPKNDDFVCITSQGITIKLKLKDIPIQGKSAMGVKIVNIEKPDVVVGIARVIKEEDEE
jgi:DNA gyrase subunit A